MQTPTIEKTDNLPVQYSPSDGAIAEMKQRFSGLTCATPTEYEKVRSAIATTRSHRVAIEKRRVELKADALAWGKKVDAEAKRLTALLLEIEEPLKAAKQAVDDEKERKAKEVAEAERKRVEDEIRAKREAEEAELRKVRETEQERLRLEAVRLEEKRVAMLAEEARLSAIRREEEEKRQAAFAIEQAKLEADRKRMADEQAAERKRLEAEHKAEQDRQKAERDKIEAERLRVESERKTIEA